MQHWPFRIVWSRQMGWIEVEDPWTGEWFEIPAKGAPRGWVQVAVEAQKPKRGVEDVRINEPGEKYPLLENESVVSNGPTPYELKTNKVPNPRRLW
jgi:hypothetical protein